MATRRWRGDAKDVAQVNTITPANVGIGNTFTVTINGKDITFTATAGTVANVTAGLVALLNASLTPEFAEITWVDSTTHVTGTADSPGKPFTQTSSAAGGTATNTTATPTANQSKNDVNDVDNWDSTIPTTGDSVFIQDTDVSLIYNLQALAAETLASLTIDRSFTGEIGLPRFTSTGYYEYRPTYWQMPSTLVTIGRGEGDGSPRIKLDGGSVQTAVTIYDTGAAAEDDDYAVRWKGTHASNVLNRLGGNVGVAVDAGETAVAATTRTGGGEADEGRLHFGTGVTHGDIDMSGGELLTQANITTLDTIAGTHEHLAGTIGTYNNDGAEFLNRSTGTITTYNGGNESTLDRRKQLQAGTITNTNLYRGASVLDPFKTLVFTNGIDLVRCAIADVTLDLGEHLTVTPSAV